MGCSGRHTGHESSVETGSVLTGIVQRLLAPSGALLSRKSVPCLGAESLQSSAVCTIHTCVTAKGDSVQTNISKDQIGKAPHCLPTSGFKARF